jgi:serine/threonine protein kinase
MTTICRKWTQSPLINPRTARKIKLDGPTYAALERECETKPKRQHAPKAKICDVWRSNPTVNPRTNRVIKINGPVYAALERECFERPRPRPRAPVTTSRFTYQLREMIKTRVNDELRKIDLKQWDMCMSGLHSQFRHNLTDVVEIGYGSYGEVYKAKIGREYVVIKESYLTEKQKILMQKFVGRNVKFGEIPKQSYPAEYALLHLTQAILSMKASPNFLYVYNIAVCDGCLLVAAEENEARPKGFCYLTIMEPADSDSIKMSLSPFTHNQHYSIFCQLMLAVHTIHSKYGIYHRDIKLANILMKRVPSGGYYEYSINNGKDTFYVENAGIMIFLSDFGVSYSLLPKIGNLFDTYGHRNAQIVQSKFRPITCKYSFDVAGGPHPALPVTWKDDDRVIMGTMNRFYDGKDLQPNIPVDLNDPITFPPFEFFNDIQDVIRAFTGGKRTLQSSAHRKIQSLQPEFLAQLKRYYVNQFPYTTSSVHFIIAAEMLKKIYVKIPRPADIIDSYVL